MDLKASMDMDKVGEATMDMDQLDLVPIVDHMDLMASMDMDTLDMDQLDLEATVDHDHSDINWSDWTGHIVLWCICVFIFIVIFLVFRKAEFQLPPPYAP